jgi:hypothetical protein
MQSKTQSLIESITGTAIGYVTAVFVSMVVYPLFGFPVTFVQANALTVIFTILSVGRSYVVRRVFNYHASR